MRLERLELPARADSRRLPEVEVLDMRERSGRSGPVHPRTREALASVTASGGKAIVMLNRRGWSPFLDCRSCGRAFGCPSCDVSLVVHSDELRCHHCGHREQLPGSCPDCGSVTLARHGAGTERAHELISEIVAPAPVFRLDSDTAAGVGGHGAILARFDAAGTGVLLGTQMVAKGHDFPEVVLGVVLDADATLRFPDFRAEERTFSLVAQLAGRSGRGDGGGRVLVQTLAPDADAIRHAAKHDAAGFLAGGARAPSRPRLPALLPPVAGADRRGRRGGRGGRGVSTCASGSARCCPIRRPCWGRHRASACAGDTAASSWSRPRSEAPASPRSARPSRPPPAPGRSEASPSASTSTPPETRSPH